MSSLRIALTRRVDGTVVFRCTRDDGTAVWQVHERANARFFPAHDLTHFAVETTLGYGDAFYGLTAAGWALTDFGSPWPRGPLPPRALEVELIVGFLDRERMDLAAGGALWTAADFATQAAAYYAEHGRREAPPLLDDPALERVRAARDALLARWAAVPAGDSLTLDFPLDR